MEFPCEYLWENNMLLRTTIIMSIFGLVLLTDANSNINARQFNFCDNCYRPNDHNNNTRAPVRNRFRYGRYYSDDNNNNINNNNGRNRYSISYDYSNHINNDNRKYSFVNRNYYNQYNNFYNFKYYNFEPIKQYNTVVNKPYFKKKKKRFFKLKIRF